MDELTNHLVGRRARLWQRPIQGAKQICRRLRNATLSGAEGLKEIGGLISDTMKTDPHRGKAGGVHSTERYVGIPRADSKNGLSRTPDKRDVRWRGRRGSNSETRPIAVWLGVWVVDVQQEARQSQAGLFASFIARRSHCGTARQSLERPLLPNLNHSGSNLSSQQERNDEGQGDYHG